MLGVLVGAGVSPLAQGRLDEPLGLAVGLRPIRPGEAVLDAQLSTDGGKGMATKGRTVIGQQPLDADPQPRVIGHGIPQEPYRAGRALIGMDIGKSHAGVVVHGHKDEVPAGAIYGVASVAGQFAYRGRRHPVGHARLWHAQFLADQLLDHFNSTHKRQSGMLMDVHPAGLLENSDCLAIISFSNPVRMNHRYNLLKLHNPKLLRGYEQS